MASEQWRHYSKVSHKVIKEVVKAKTAMCQRSVSFMSELVRTMRGRRRNRVGKLQSESENVRALCRKTRKSISHVNLENE